MKYLFSQITFLFESSKAKRNIKLLWKFFLVLFVMIISYSFLFHILMLYEGRYFSWITGLYWTLTVMSTLGFGDITFHTDLGKIFSIFVLVSGVVFLLILFPFSFIRFFYAPWIEAQAKLKAPRELPENTSNHIILTSFDDVTEALINKLKAYKKDYVIIVEEFNKALELNDLGYRVAVGLLDDPQTYHKMRVQKASLVVAVANDELNTNIAYTVREISESIPIVTNANSQDSLDILELAGSNYVLNLKQLLGQALARRTAVGGAKSNTIGQIDKLIIAEAPAIGTPLVGKSLKDSRIREKIGINVVGIWDRGIFKIPRPDTIINNYTVLVLAGSQEQLQFYDGLFCIYHTSESPVLILGYGQVGRYTAEALQKRNIKYNIIEKNPAYRNNDQNIIIGNAADLNILKQVGIFESQCIIITTRNDATNIYLTIYCRRLRPDIQIISRANLDRNVSTLHRAGADLVLSYASLGANTILNFLEKGKVLMLSEGLDVFKVNAPLLLIGKKIKDSAIREQTECNLIAVIDNGEMIINPVPEMIIKDNFEMLLIGKVQSELKFLEIFGK